MAIDTASKRLSCLDYEEPWAEAMPIPDGTIDQGDRQHAIWSYSGILATGSVVPVTPLGKIYTMPRRKTYVLPRRKIYSAQRRNRVGQN